VFKLSACSKQACFESYAQRVNGCADDAIIYVRNAVPSVKQALSPKNITLASNNGNIIQKKEQVS